MQVMISSFFSGSETQTSSPFDIKPFLRREEMRSQLVRIGEVKEGVIMICVCVRIVGLAHSPDFSSD
jgi:hypothetical protein